MNDNFMTHADGNELDAEQLRRLLENAIEATEQNETSLNGPAATGKAMKLGRERVVANRGNRPPDAVARARDLLSRIDQRIGAQIAAIIHHERFRQLEGSWRGLRYLVDQANVGEMLQLKVLHCTKRELHEDFDGGVEEFDTTATFKLIFENEYGMPGGLPYSILVGDYQFDHATPGDLTCLEALGNIAAASLSPLLTSPSSRLFGIKGWSELEAIPNLRSLFEQVEYVKWRKFRESEASRYVVLTLPRTLARSPYWGTGSAHLDFRSDDARLRTLEQEPLAQWAEGGSGADENSNFCWMNAAYLLAARIAASFAETQWFLEISGVEGGGRIEGLPTVRSEDGHSHANCPVEVLIEGQRHQELSGLGFLPICYIAQNDCLAFVSLSTLHKPKTYYDEAATAHSAIMARLPWVMISSRFGQYIRVLSRESEVDFENSDEIAHWLNKWIVPYCYPQERSDYGAEMRARKPLEDGRVEVECIAGSPGYYQAKIYLHPWMPDDKMTMNCCTVVRLFSHG